LILGKPKVRNCRSNS